MKSKYGFRSIWRVESLNNVNIQMAIGTQNQYIGKLSYYKVAFWRLELGTSSVK